MSKLELGDICAYCGNSWLAREREQAQLRDEFAKAALTGLLASVVFSKNVDGAIIGCSVAREAYYLADAMLKTREEQT